MTGVSPQNQIRRSSVPEAVPVDMPTIPCLGDPSVLQPPRARSMQGYRPRFIGRHPTQVPVRIAHDRMFANSFGQSLRIILQRRGSIVGSYPVSCIVETHSQRLPKTD